MKQQQQQQQQQIDKDTGTEMTTPKLQSNETIEDEEQQDKGEEYASNELKSCQLS